jgi:hypothetical protein
MQPNTWSGGPDRRSPALPFRALIALSGILLSTVTACSSASSIAPSAAASDAAAAGDIPDNAVFLTYTDSGHGFSIQYVEGWQVAPDATGVTIRDKDSSETVEIVQTSSDPATYLQQTDLPALRTASGFALVSQDSVTIANHAYLHLVYRMPSPPDPVTGKQVPSTVDRYYVPGSGSLALVTLSTPNGVDNVDAFRQMITSFAWQ